MNERIRVHQRAALLGLAGFSLSFALGACFNGADARGLACTSDEQCGLDQTCDEGYCDGVFICADGGEIEAGEVCDFIEDCGDGSDEAANLCFGDEELYECEDGTLIPLEFVCDTEDDCEGGEDELGCAGIGLNECTGEGSGPDIAYEPTPAGGGMVPDPLDLKVVQLIGPSEPEVISGNAGGTELEVFDFGDGEFDQPPMVRTIGPFDGRTVVDFALGEVNGDDDTDVIVATQDGTGMAVHVYQNNAPDDPTPYGVPLLYSLPGAGLGLEIQAIGLGRLNNDSSTDMVVIANGENFGNGLLLVSFGDSAAAAEGQAYFSPQLLEGVGALGYTDFLDMVMLDLDNNGYDDIVISAVGNDGPGIWVIYREGEELLSGWNGPNSIMGVMGMPSQLAVANYSGGPFPGVVVVDPLMRSMQTFRNMNGMLLPPPPDEGPLEIAFEADPTGLIAGDLNCDGRDDFVFHQNDSLGILIGDGTGGVLDTTPIFAELDGNGTGAVGIAQFDDDGTPDLFSTISGVEGVQIALSTGLADDPTEAEDEAGGE